MGTTFTRGDLTFHRADLRSRTDHLLKMLDMTAIADRRVAGFSHGERTKTALARAIVHNPKNVLLDEPTNGLDVMSTRAVREIIRRKGDGGRDQERGRRHTAKQELVPKKGAIECKSRHLRIPQLERRIRAAKRRLDQ